MKKIILVTILSSLVGGLLLAQTEGAWFVGKKIVGFQFQGLQSVAEKDLLAILEPYKNKDFTYRLYDEIQARLMSLEYFESVAADALAGDPEKNTVIIRFTFKERPLISRIFFEGRSNLWENDLRGVILTKEQAVFSEARLRMDREAIRNLYISKGFLDAEVEYSFNQVKDTNLIEVTFKIKEGAKVTIKKIQFSGNQFASEGTLKGLLQSKEIGFLVNSDFSESKIKDDIAAIEKYYGENGYYFVKVEKVDKQYEVNEAEGRKYIILTFYIKENYQYTFGGVRFEGNRVFNTEKLQALIRQKPGDILNKRRFQEDFLRILDLYYDSGYVTTQINSKENVDEIKKEISFVISFKEGDCSHIGKIIIRGNTKTKEIVIRRELPFEEGEVFSKAKIQQGYINLLRTGFFAQNILFEPVPGSDPNLIDIVITVEEQRTAQLEVGATVTPGDFPFSAYANLADKNFLGDGVMVSLNLQLMPLVQSLGASYQNNWLFGQRLIGGINFQFKHEIVQNVPQDILGPVFYGDEPYAVPDPFSTKEEYEAALASGVGIPPEYTMEYHSIQFSVGLVVGYGFDTLLGLLQLKAEPSVSLSYITYDDTINRPFSNLLRAELNQWLFINRLGLTVALNATDIQHNPESGYFMSQYLGITGTFLGGSRHYTRSVTELEGYLKLFTIPIGDWDLRLVLALHTQLSFVLPPLWGEMVSVEEDYYRIDGMWVGRGWYLQQRGKILWDNKLELRMPLAENILWWTIFFCDVAGLWKETEDFLTLRAEDFYFTMGTGLRLIVPGLPLRVYFAKRFRVEDGIFTPQAGALKLWEGFDFDFIFTIDINPF